MRFKVLVATKLRPTASMYNVATSAVGAGSQFDSMGSVTGSDVSKPADVGVIFEQYSANGWIPRVYSGVTYLQEVVPVPSPSTEVYPVKSETTMSDGTVYVATNFVKE